MNRAERRAKGVTRKDPCYTLTKSQIDNIKSKATDDALTIAFKLLVCIPVMVIHDKYSKLIKKDVDGMSREERMAEYVIDLYDTFQQGYITLEELEECLRRETGMRFEEYKK